jgi:hypothetical protein
MAILCGLQSAASARLGSRRIRSAAILLVPLLLGGCVPPQILLIPVVLPGIVLGLCFILFGFKSATMRTQGVLILALALVYFFGYVTPIAVQQALGDNSSYFGLGGNSPYAEVIAVAAVSACIVGASAWFLRRWGAISLAPSRAGAFSFLVFFVLNFGYQLTSSEIVLFANSPSLGYFWFVILLGQVPYLAFILAPLSAMVRWRGARNRGEMWGPSKIAEANLKALWLLLTALIAGVATTNGVFMGFPMLGVELEALLSQASGDAATGYTQLTLYREILFVYTAHDVIVAILLTLGYRHAVQADTLGSLRNLILGGVLGLVLLAVVPFYLGQKAAIDQFAARDSESAVQRDRYRSQLLTTRPLYPTSTALAHLIVSLTAGGVFVFSLRLPGLKVQVG